MNPRNTLTRSIPRIHVRNAFVSAGLLLIVGGAAHAQQILEVNGATLTSYAPAAATASQDVWPLFVQRGVNLDGTVREGSPFGWSLAGNPSGESWNTYAQVAGVNLASGVASITKIDLALPSQGPRWVVGRTFNSAQVNSSPAHRDSNGFQGYNWFQTSQPELKYVDGGSGGLGSGDTAYIVYGADRYIEFKWVSTSLNDANTRKDEFKAVNGAAGVLQRVDDITPGTNPDLWTYTDQRGTQTVFFGGNTASNAADWQLWKITDEAGNAVYVGDASSATTAVTSGYSGKVVQVAYDGTHRYTTTMSGTIGGRTRIARVKAESKTGGTWGSPTGLATVGQVDYDYYTSDVAYGKAGDLKLVTITTPLSDGSTNLETNELYLYYVDPWSGTAGRRGEPHQIQMIVGPEGFRKRDIGTPDPLTDTADDLKPYSEAFFEYVSGSDYRIAKAFFNGECGCGGGSANGTYEFSYGASSSYATYVGNTSYDTENLSNPTRTTAVWATRTVVKQPDSTYVTHYFDEAGQQLSRVITNSDPSGSPSGTWAHYTERNASGQLTAMYSPASITAYTHSSGSVAYTRSSSAGLVTTFTRASSGDMTGFLEDTKYQEGYSGTAYLLTGLAYGSVSKAVGSSGVVRPYVSAIDRYKTAVTSKAIPDTADDYDTTSVSTTPHSSALSDKVITRTAPTVTTGKNGSGSANVTKLYLRADGTVAFTEDANGVFTYTQYTNGQLVKRIEDCQTNHGSDFAVGDDPNTNFGITETGAGLRYIRVNTYDGQGRPDAITLPNGRVMKMFYHKLADGRMATLSIPRYVAGSPNTAYGPVQYNVSNHAGKTEYGATIRLDGGSSTVSLASWINEAEPDPYEAFDDGTVDGEVAYANESVYSNDGHRLKNSGRMFAFPAGDSDFFDRVNYDYDEMGRTRRVEDATGTITRTVFDALGRVIERETGTDDTGDPGSTMSGSNNMVKIEELQYDGGSAGGNSYLTQRTLFVQDSTTGQRVTAYANDYRGRMILQTNPQAPHMLNKVDNLSRVTATGFYSSASGLSAASAPTTTTNRVGYGETLFDEMGRVYQTLRHKITQSGGSAGASTDSLATDTWYDPVGRVMKVRGEQLTKTRHDRLGRVTHRFTLATSDDSQYGHASASTAVWDSDDQSTSVAGDIVLEEAQTAFDNTTPSGLVLMQVGISRHYSDLSNGTAGALDSGADSDPMVVTAANIKGRVQITSMWYDTLDRLENTVAYGTNAIVGDGSTSAGTFTRTSLSVPSRSDTELVTTNTYGTDGKLVQIEDPKGLLTRYEYNIQGLKSKEIRNYVDGTPSADTDQTTTYTYTAGLLTTLTAVMPGGGSNDQVTTYDYGVVKGTNPGDSKISAGYLLAQAIYPEQSGGQSTADKSVYFAYNAQGQPIWTKDQTGTIIETDYDTSGRETHRRATTTAGGIDTAVLRISTTYTSRGQRELVTSYNNATVGSGSIVNEVKNSYDDWALLASFEQDNNSTVGAGGSVDDYEVAYTYSKSAPSAGRHTLRRDTQKLRYASTDQQTLTFEYLSTSNSLDADLARVSDVKLGSTVVATYKYNGAGQLLGTRLDEPAMFSQAYVAGASTGVYGNIDRFGRVTSSTWVKDATTDRDVYDVDLTYDRNSNITSATDNINRNGSGTRIFDVKYTMDGLNRLTQAEEGTYSTGSISNGSRQEDYAIDLGNNITTLKVDLNYDGAWGGAGEMNDTRTYNKPNELLTRDLDTNPGTTGNNYTLTYNKRGDMTDDGLRYKMILDAFGRITSVTTRGGSPVTVAEYRYDGNNRRIGWHYDSTRNGGGAPDGTVDSYDPWYWFAHDDRWRIVATFRGSSSSATDTSPKEQFVFHAAGLSGTGGSSYIDSVVLREKDDNSGWISAADGTLEQRRYYLQNWRADVSNIVEADGAQVERIKYSPYGVPNAYTPADFNQNNAVTSQDDTDFQAALGVGTDIRCDVTGDAVIDFSDYLAFLNEYSGSEVGGRGVLSRASNTSRIGYAGYQHAAELQGTKWHVRHRVLDSELGRWNRRDPLEFVDGQNLFCYLIGTPLGGVDPDGLRWERCPGGCFDSEEQPLDPLVKCCNKLRSDGAKGIVVTVCCGQTLHTCFYDDRIRKDADGDDSAFNIIKTCAAVHESTYYDGDFDCSKCPNMPSSPCHAGAPNVCGANCAECTGALAEAACLAASLTRCQTAACVNAVGRRLIHVTEMAAHQCALCAVCTGNPFQPKPGDGVRVPL